ncbi:MAG: hypothetical protein FWC45_05305, partial [Treponema sp.]|nr:hypothetical protein [Treponema sp.]
MSNRGLSIRRFDDTKKGVCMKKFTILGFVVLAAMLFAFAACSSPSGPDTGPTTKTARTVTYSGVSGTTQVKLEITENLNPTNRGAYEPQVEDSYTLTYGDKVSTGTVTDVSSDGILTLQPANAESPPFDATVSGSSLTKLEKTIYWDNVSLDPLIDLGDLIATITNAALTITAPKTGAAPAATASGTGDFTIGAVSWNPTDNPFIAETVYTASVTLTANTGFTFTGIPAANATINGAVAEITNNTGDAVTLSYKFNPTAAAGSSTPNTNWYSANPGASNFNIAGADDLAGLAQLVNGGTSFKNKTILLQADIDLSAYGLTYNSGKGWIPIGTDMHPFDGIFDGNGRAILNLSIKNTLAEDSYNQGLFGENDGTIKNVALLYCSIVSDYMAGGIVGTNTNLIEKCFTKDGTIKGISNIGGVVGVNYGTIQNCYSRTNVSGGAGDKGENTYIGGITGQTRGMVQNCYATGSVTGADSIGGIIGGIFAGIGTVQNCAALNSAIYSNYMGNKFHYGRVSPNDPT